MNYVESLKIFGVHAKEIPCVTAEGAPTENTEGRPGVLYMDTVTGILYKCREADFVNEVFTWEKLNDSQGAAAGDGRGIQGVVAEELEGTTVVRFEYTDGTYSGDIEIPHGKDGATGEQGPQGEKGEKGDTGAAGKDGTSPTVAVEEITGGHRVTITDVNGSKTVDVMDGEAGSGNLPLYYIAPDGSDSNDGLTADTPKKTVKACVCAGAKRISAKRGTYAEQVSLTNIDYLEIFPTDNDQEYSVDADWTPITFDLSDTLEVGNPETYNSINRIAYTNSANEQFDKVFSRQSQSGVIGTGYNAAVWLMSSDEKTVCIKLKPVVTIAEVEAEANTFSWVDGYIYINADLTGAEKICVPTNWDSGFRIANAGKVVLREVEVRFSGAYNLWILNCPHFDLYKCSARYSSYASGIDIDNANGTLTACYATKNYDGFGISGYGHTTYIDCVSEFNTDDGVSHHNGSCGTFIGGRFEGNGKGGNAPAYGANVNIYGGIYKDNAQFGIGYLHASGYHPANGMVQGAVMVGNGTGLKVQANCAVTAISCLYKNNTVEKEVKGTLTEYNIDIPACDGDHSGDSGGTYNLLPAATDTDRTTIYNGIGYKPLTRLSSDGTVKSVAESATYAAICTTGFIPAVAGDVLRVSGIGHITGTAEYIVAYDSANAVTGKIQINLASDGGNLGIWDSSVTENASFELTLTEELLGANFNAVRLSCVVNDTSMITINQENA